MTKIRFILCKSVGKSRFMITKVNKNKSLCGITGLIKVILSVKKIKWENFLILCLYVS